MKRFMFAIVIVLTLAVAAGASGASARSASIPSRPVMLVCTSVTAINYALEVVVLTDGKAGVKQGDAAVTALYKAAEVAGQPFISESIALGNALESEKWATTNRAFTALASSCQAHGDPIVLFTL